MGSCSAWPWEQARPSSHPISNCPHTSAQSRPPPPQGTALLPEQAPRLLVLPVFLPPEQRPGCSLPVPLPSTLGLCQAASRLAGWFGHLPPSHHCRSPVLSKLAPTCSALPVPTATARPRPCVRPGTSSGQPVLLPLQDRPGAHLVLPLSAWLPPPLLIPMDPHSCQAAVSPQLGAGSVSELEPLPDLTPLGPRNTGSASVLTWGLPTANKPRLAVLPAPHLHLHGEAEPSSLGSCPSEARGCFLCSVLFSELGLHVSLGPWGGGTPGLCQPPHC